MDLLSLIVACAPFVSPDTMSTFVEKRSGGNPFVIQITETGRRIRPKDKDEAIAVAVRLVEEGSRIKAGLAQIDSAEWKKFGLTVETVFDPCSNLEAGERVVVGQYHGAKRPPARAAKGRPKIAQLVRNLAPAYSLDPELVLAVIEAESNFNPKALSPKQAQGLMQLIPATAKRFGVRDVWDPEQNLRGGMAYLRWLLKHFKGDVRLALAGYNAGEKAVERHGGIPPYRETQTYVRKIMRRVGDKPARLAYEEGNHEGRAGKKAHDQALLFDVMADGFSAGG